MPKKIAIYGGAFNPPTLGHIHVIIEVLKNTDIEKIIIVPDGLRLDKEYNIPEVHRNNLIEIFINELSKKDIDIEVDKYFMVGKNNSDTTTHEVDRYFIEKYNSQPWHIFGTDICEGIKYWSGNPNKYIQKKLKKIFIPRKGYKFNDFELDNYILVETSIESDISSTKVKENIEKGVNFSTLTMGKIKEYIEDNKLYK